MAAERNEPTAAELAEIEREWPQIEADLRRLDSEIRAMAVVGQVCELDRRRVRRAQRRALHLVALRVTAADRGWPDVEAEARGWSRCA